MILIFNGCIIKGAYTPLIIQVEPQMIKRVYGLTSFKISGQSEDFIHDSFLHMSSCELYKEELIIEFYDNSIYDDIRIQFGTNIDLSSALQHVAEKMTTYENAQKIKASMGNLLYTKQGE